MVSVTQHNALETIHAQVWQDALMGTVQADQVLHTVVLGKVSVMSAALVVQFAAEKDLAIVA